MKGRSFAPIDLRTSRSPRTFRMTMAPQFEDRLRATRLDDPETFERALREAPQVTGGRGPHVLLADSKGEAPAIRIRTYHRGGWIGGFARSVFASPARAIREFHLWQTLQMRGAPIPEAVFARAERKRGLWRLHFATLDRPHALDGLAWFSDPEKCSSWPAALASCARSIRAFHNAGCVHGDLNLRNLLFEASPIRSYERSSERGTSGSSHSIAGDPVGGSAGDSAGQEAIQCWLVDLADARLRDPVSPTERLRDLMRLLRSAEKQGIPFADSTRHHARFLSAYCGSDRGLRAALLRALPAERLRLTRHRIGWRLRGKPLPSLAAAFHFTAALNLAAALILISPLACRDASTERSETGAAANESGWSILATGDTGRTGSSAFLESLTEGQLSVARAMTEEARRDSVDALVLLGDNFYWRGLDREHLLERLRRNLVVPYCYFFDLSGPRSSEIDSACSLETNARQPVPVYAVLGNHDLETAESPELQRRVVPEFLPGWQMSRGLAEVIEVEEGISLILLESEVAIRDKAATRRALFDAVMAARGPWRIVATHRPIATDDVGGVPEGGYPTMVQETLAEAAQAGHPVQLVLSAHHHNLQAFELTAPARLLQIGLGAGARAEGPLAAPNHPAARFGAISLGFARVERVGQGDAERLSVRLISAPRWPWLYLFQSPSEIARFTVDRTGRVAGPGRK